MLCVLALTTCEKSVPPAAHIRFDLKDDKSTPANPPEYGYLSVDPKTKQVIAQRNAKVGFIPASVSKVPTALAALAVLGPRHRFQTKLAIRGVVRNGVLEGDLFLYGGGDPGLLMRDVADLSDAILRSGIYKITGKFVVDDSALPRKDIINETMGGDAAYNPALSALSVHYNMIRARWTSKAEAYPFAAARPKKRRSQTSRSVSDYRFTLIPDLPLHRLKATSQIAPGQIGEFEYKLDDDQDTWLYQTDFLKKNYRRYMKYLPVRRPALYAGHLVRKFASMRGAELPAPEEGRLPVAHTVLHVHEGRELIELTETMLQWSNNLMADLLLLSTGKKLAGHAVSLEESGKYVTAFWKRVLPSVDWSSFEFVNGSGLTGLNRISPEQMVAMLTWADEQDFGGTRFANTLPVTGWSGSLRRRLRFPETTFRVQAKTGTIFYGVALAGEYYDRYNRRRVFVQFYHDPARRAILDDLEKPERARLMRRGAYGWVRNSREALDDRLLSWVLKPTDEPPPPKQAASR